MRCNSGKVCAMKLPTKILSIVAGVLVTTGLAVAQDNAETATEAPSARLAPGGLIFVERGDHKPPDILSANGRYVLTVALYDRWTKRYVATVGDADYSVSHLDFDVVGLNIDDLAPDIMGQGSRKVTVFADPAGDNDVAMLRELMGNATVRDQFMIQVVFVPTRSQRSIALTKQLACLPKNVGLKAVLAGVTKTLPKGPDRCNGFIALQKRVATATLVGVNATPYLVAPNTRIHAGRPDDVVQWLMDNSRD